VTTLICDSCPETAEDVQPAMDHVRANFGHKMTGAVDDEGTTVTVSIDDDLEDDEWYGPEDDWADQ
jgi:hypothetical protein